jgi:hypothetical protein
MIPKMAYNRNRGKMQGIVTFARPGSVEQPLGHNCRFRPSTLMASKLKAEIGKEVSLSFCTKDGRDVPEYMMREKVKEP